ncbi:sterol desaturase family protein [Paenibacillus gansuensis]|uniref:Sterol desaturase family protein n=1 Tax=Paenibacillus gansuensis TaxID=306542 RepID=A0ABW5PA55_9BACL
MRKYVKEFFGHKDVLVMCALLLLAFGYCADSLGRWQSWAAIASGALTYTFSEYAIHRFLFHLKPPKNRLFLSFLRRLHYDHHVVPDDIKLMLLPVWYSLPLISGVCVLLYVLTGDTKTTAAFFTGTAGFLLYYEWTHYAAHRPIVPRTPWGRWMKKVHLWHHFQNEHYWFGVTNTLYDRLFGTFREPKQTERSSSARNLET